MRLKTEMRLSDLDGRVMIGWVSRDLNVSAEKTKKSRWSCPVKLHEISIMN